MRRLLLIMLCCIISTAYPLRNAFPTTLDNSNVTREFLLSKGFIQEQGIYHLPRMQIGKAAALLGFKLSDMRSTPSQPIDSDTRIVRIRDLWFVVVCAEKSAGGKAPASLDKPGTLAEISVSLHQVPPDQERRRKEIPSQ